MKIYLLMLIPALLSDQYVQIPKTPYGLHIGITSASLSLRGFFDLDCISY